MAGTARWLRLVDMATIYGDVYGSGYGGYGGYGSGYGNDPYGYGYGSNYIDPNSYASAAPLMTAGNAGTLAAQPQYALTGSDAAANAGTFADRGEAAFRAGDYKALLLTTGDMLWSMIRKTRWSS